MKKSKRKQLKKSKRSSVQRKRKTQKKTTQKRVDKLDQSYHSRNGTGSRKKKSKVKKVVVLSPQEMIQERRNYMKMKAYILIATLPILFLFFLVLVVRTEPSTEALKGYLTMVVIGLGFTVFVGGIYLKDKAENMFKIECPQCKIDIESSQRNKKITHSGKYRTTYFEYFCDKCGEMYPCELHDVI